MKPILLCLTLLLCALSPTLAAAEPGNYAHREDVAAFVDEMVAEGFDRAMLEAAFKDARYQQSIVDAISRPAERTLSWKEYQDIFLTRSRVEKGESFIHQHRDALVKAQEQYGVPVTIITAIIGVETLYGRITGSYRVLDSLSTLAFDYPPRSKFFRSELKQFFYLAGEEGQEIGAPTGSYAGAMGYGQFISSSFRNFAVDFDEDGQRDIWNNPVDAIGSVANYIARHGWRPGELVTLKVGAPPGVQDDAFNQSLKPSRRVDDLKDMGILLPEPLPPETEVSPMLLNGKAGKEYWLGLQNFYAITRYNHSKLYAMAVFQLSERLKAELAS